MKGKMWYIFEDLSDISLIEDFFIKIRTIFKIREENYTTKSEEHDDYKVEVYAKKDDMSNKFQEYIIGEIGEKSFQSRLQKDNCYLYFASSKHTDEPAGYYWGVLAKDKPIWHDNFKISPMGALVFNAYVEEDHRKNGVYRLLQGKAHNHLLHHTDCREVYTIVEDRNLPSLKANSSFGLDIYGKNYLIKLFAVNIFSIVIMAGSRYTYFVLGKEDL